MSLGPIAAMFWLDEGLGSELYIDGKLRQVKVFAHFLSVDLIFVQEL